MCEPVILTSMAIGAATGAVGAAVTGGDVLQGAFMGGITGAVTGGMLPDPGFSSTGFLSNLGNTFGASTTISSTFGMSAAQAVGMGISGLATSIGTGLLMPQAQSFANPYLPNQAYNTPEHQITGSGGRQAPAVLAEQIKNVKQRRAKQEDQGDLGLTTIQDTGLQFA